MLFKETTPTPLNHLYILFYSANLLMELFNDLAKFTSVHTTKMVYVPSLLPFVF